MEKVVGDAEYRAVAVASMFHTPVLLKDFPVPKDPPRQTGCCKIRDRRDS
jgi:hypothetical protein